MTSLVTKLVIGKLFKESKSNKQGYEDPYFETVPATRLGFKSKKKLPKAHPPGLTEKEAAILTKAKRRAYRLDLSLGSFFGIRCGWGAVIGLIPGIGDVLDMLLCLMVYRTICSVEPSLDSSLKMKMKFNIIIDFFIGLIPFAGDIADAAYKCNTKNVILFENELRKRGKKRLKGTPQENMADPSLPDEFDYQAEEDARTRNGPPPRYTSRRDRARGGRRDDSTVDIESEAGYTESTIEPPRRVKTNDRRDRRDRRDRH
ncbi:uncharacterized protein HMPREF1541_09685 [Cyphellophora europaea CBS 101466]|uniref:PH domain-containing protein n=1 Tax=Cyphellophora europaea (strain CBS 101466) TaxID=1220924 RepID=W2S852_CYPE1|nr:uncharacterized protein HMPREF1541_09685 [Cyphellophora europaea CBS 101466]ETN44810.1 hypothetical protein HMPREF1541_09685 [Cyphellophora europaea CBS 101466]